MNFKTFYHEQVNNHQEFLSEAITNKFLRKKLDELRDDATGQLKKKIEYNLQNDIVLKRIGKYEFLLSTFLISGDITPIEVGQIINKNKDDEKYLYWFKNNNSATFGRQFEKFIIENTSLKQASKSLDPNFKPGSYDLWYNGIRIEVKATRITEPPKYAMGDSYVERAAYSSSKTRNAGIFAQLKPYLSDVFIFAVIFRDKIKWFVIPSSDIMKIPGVSVQHRDSQLYAANYRRSSEKFFEKYETSLKDIERAVEKAYKKQQKS